MADHAIVIAAADVTTATGAATALNTLLAAEITAAAPQPMQLINVDALQLVGAPGDFIYTMVALVKLQG